MQFNHYYFTLINNLLFKFIKKGIILLEDMQLLWIFILF